MAHGSRLLQEHYRYGMSSNVNDKTLYELYLAPYMRAVDACGLICAFESADSDVMQADVSGIMCAYNQVALPAGGWQHF